MNKRSVALLGAGLSLLILSGCSRTKEEVFQRLSSPDGQYEAIMMRCGQASDPSVPEMVVAVFTEKGRGCDQPYVHAVTGVNLSHPFEEGAHAIMRWDGGTLIVTSQGERQYYSGTLMAQNQNIIRLEGPIADKHYWNRTVAE